MDEIGVRFVMDDDDVNETTKYEMKLLPDDRKTHHAMLRDVTYYISKNLFTNPDPKSYKCKIWSLTRGFSVKMFLIS